MSKIEIFNIPPDHENHAVDTHIPNDFADKIDAELGGIDLEHLETKVEVGEYLDVYAKKILPRILHEQFVDEWENVKLLLHSQDGVRAIVNSLLAQPDIVSAIRGGDKNRIRTQAEGMRREASRIIQGMLDTDVSDPDVQASLKRASSFLVKRGGEALTIAIKEKAEQYGHPLVEEFVGSENTVESSEARKVQDEKIDQATIKLNALMADYRTALENGQGARAKVLKERIDKKIDPKQGIFTEEFQQDIQDAVLAIEEDVAGSQVEKDELNSEEKTENHKELIKHTREEYIAALDDDNDALVATLRDRYNILLNDAMVVRDFNFLNTEATALSVAERDAIQRQETRRSAATETEANTVKTRINALLVDYETATNDNKEAAANAARSAIEKRLSDEKLQAAADFSDYRDAVTKRLGDIDAAADSSRVDAEKIQAERVKDPINSLGVAEKANVATYMQAIERVALFGDLTGQLAIYKQNLKSTIDHLRSTGENEWADALDEKLQPLLNLELLNGSYAENQAAQMWQRIHPEQGLGCADWQLALENAASEIILKFRETIRNHASLVGAAGPDIIRGGREEAQDKFNNLLDSCKKHGVALADRDILNRFFNENINQDFEQSRLDPIIDQEIPGSRRETSTKAYFAVWAKRFAQITEADRAIIFASSEFTADTFDIDAMMHFMRQYFGGRYKGIDILDAYLSDTTGNRGKRARDEAERMHILQRGIDLYNDNQQRLSRGESPINGREIDPTQVQYLNELNSAARYLATMQAEIMFYHEGHRGRDRLVRERDNARARYGMLMDIMAAQISAEYAGPPEDEREHMINFLRQTQLEEDLKLENTFIETSAILNEVFTPSSETTNLHQSWEKLGDGTKKAIKVVGFVGVIATPLGWGGGILYAGVHLANKGYNKVREMAKGGDTRRSRRHVGDKDRLRNEYREVQEDADWRHHIHGVAEHFIATTELEEQYTRRRDLGSIAILLRIRSNVRLLSGLNQMELGETGDAGRQHTAAAQRIRHFQNSLGIMNPAGSPARNFYLSETQALRAVTCLSDAEIATLNSIDTVAELNMNSALVDRLREIVLDWRGYNRQHGAYINKKVIKR